MNRTTISRRQILQALAAATVVALYVIRAAARGRTRAAAGHTTPLVPPFRIDRLENGVKSPLNYQCVDYKKAAAFYATLMGWKVRGDDGKQRCWIWATTRAAS